MILILIFVISSDEGVIQHDEKDNHLNNNINQFIFTHLPLSEHLNLVYIYY